MGVKLDGNAKQLADPVELDTTRIGWAANNKIYTTIFSDDKQKIMVLQVHVICQFKHCNKATQTLPLILNIYIFVYQTGEHQARADR